MEAGESEVPGSQTYNFKFEASLEYVRLYSELRLQYRTDFQGSMAVPKEFNSGFPFLLYIRKFLTSLLFFPPVWDHHQNTVIFANHKLNFRSFNGLQLHSEIKHESLKNPVTNYLCSLTVIMSSFLIGLLPAAAPPFLNRPSTLPPPVKALGTCSFVSPDSISWLLQFHPSVSAPMLPLWLVLPKLPLSDVLNVCWSLCYILWLLPIAILSFVCWSIFFVFLFCLL